MTLRPTRGRPRLHSCPPRAATVMCAPTLARRGRRRSTNPHPPYPTRAAQRHHNNQADKDFDIRILWQRQSRRVHCGVSVDSAAAQHGPAVVAFDTAVARSGDLPLACSNKQTGSDGELAIMASASIPRREARGLHATLRQRQACIHGCQNYCHEAMRSPKAVSFPEYHILGL